MEKKKKKEERKIKKRESLHFHPLRFKELEKDQEKPEEVRIVPTPSLSHFVEESSGIFRTFR